MNAWCKPCRGGEVCGKEQLAGEGWREKNQFFPCRDQYRLAKVYKFLAKVNKALAKLNQNVPIPCHGKKNVNLIPRRELLARKSLIF